MDVDTELLRNYADLRKQRGWSWDEMADAVAPMSRELAAELRKQNATRGTADAARSDPPRARSAPRKPSAAD